MKQLRQCSDRILNTSELDESRGDTGLVDGLLRVGDT